MEPFTERQQTIIEQALQLIAEQGIEKLTYRNLAKKVGITEPAFYRHFASKTEIMLGILTYVDGIRQELFDRIYASSTSSLTAIGSIFQQYTELFEKNPAFIMILFPEVIRQNREELGGKVLEMMNTGQENITAIITDGINRGEIRDDVDKEQVALIISGGLRLLATRWQLEKYSGDLQEQGSKFWNALLSLIRSEQGVSTNANLAGDETA